MIIINQFTRDTAILFFFYYIATKLSAFSIKIYGKNYHCMQTHLLLVNCMLQKRASFFSRNLVER